MIMDQIDKFCNDIINSVVLNERKWGVLSAESKDMSDEQIKELYMEQVNWLKNWIHERFIYLDTKY
jgi:hypothetical protein